MAEIKYWHENTGDANCTELLEVPTDEYRINRWFARYIDRGLGTVFLPQETPYVKNTEFRGRKVIAEQEGGRSSTLERFLSVGDQQFVMNVKGTGARIWRGKNNLKFYGSLSHLNRKEYGRLRDVVNKKKAAFAITNEEDYFGRPIGGQRYDWAKDDINLSDGAFSRFLGMYICPVLSISKIPEEAVVRTNFGYPIVNGIAQELRLLPSNIRLADDRGISRLRDVKHEIPKTKPEKFIHNLCKTATQIVTMPARLAEPFPSNSPDKLYSTLEFDGVYASKDGVIAEDGKMYLADLEGVTPWEFKGGNEPPTAENIRKKVEEDLNNTLGWIQTGVLWLIYNSDKTEKEAKFPRDYWGRDLYSVNREWFLEQNFNSIQEGLPKNVGIIRISRSKPEKSGKVRKKLKLSFNPS